MKSGVVTAETSHIVDRPGDTGLVFACFEEAVCVPGVDCLILIETRRGLAEFNDAQKCSQQQDEQQDYYWPLP